MSADVQSAGEASKKNCKTRDHVTDIVRARAPTYDYNTTFNMADVLQPSRRLLFSFENVFKSVF